MGNGIRIGDKLNFQITANYNMNANDLLRWQRAFLKASEILHNATEGQLSFGTIFVNNDNVGVNNAEFVLDPDVTGRALGTWGQFGTIGRAIQLPAYAQRQVLSIIHELGHHLWALNEEYARSAGGQVDKMVALPAGHGNLIIPLVNADLGIPDAEFAGGTALLTFGGNVETRIIDNKSGDEITVTSAFSQNPQNIDGTGVTIQWTTGVECTGDRTTGACIMEFSRSNAGELENDGTWTPAANPVTEFCTEHNHDPDEDTAQHDSYSASCWDTIIGRSGYTDLTAPPAGSAANTTAPAGYVAPNWIELNDQLRFALILDKSGSMNRNGGSRLEGTKTGAAYWLENAAVEGDFLSVIWFSTSIDPLLSLTDFSMLSETDVENLVSDVENQLANGGTNIRDGLAEGLNEMLSPGDLSALQASLLLTDGAHNSPLGSSMLEVVPDYQDNNANIYTLGIGSGAEMDLDGLEDLAEETGGSSFTVGDGSNSSAIQNSMIEINNLIRGGLLTTPPDMLPDMKEGDALSKLKLDPETPPKKRPSILELFKELEIDMKKSLTHVKRYAAGRYALFYIDIEEGASSATFTLSFEKHEKLWMYLIDPRGNEVTISSREMIAFVSTGQPYEFAKIEKPIPGKWTIVAFRPINGTAVSSKVITGIQHKAINVYARAKASLCGVKIEAGARYRELLTGIHATAILRNERGRIYQIPLYDKDQIGEYTADSSLPKGRYEGYVEIKSPGNTLVANFQHAILHAEHMKELPDLRIKHPAFVRQVPIAFYTGPRKEPIIAEDELKEIYTERNRRKKYQKNQNQIKQYKIK